MCCKIRCHEESENFYKISGELNKAELVIEEPGRAARNRHLCFQPIKEGPIRESPVNSELLLTSV